MERMSKSTDWIKIIGAAAVLVFCEAFFFRNIIGNDFMFGDLGDGRLTNLITEHWWQFFCGNVRFLELPMFYPAEGVLGYTDMFLGYGIIHSIYRACRMNMYLAYKLTLMTVHGMGTASMFYLLRKKMKLRMAWSLFGTIAFCYSDSLSRHVIHTQLMAVSMLPVLLIFFIGFMEQFENRKKRNIYAYLCMAWFALLTYTAWYVAFFTGMFCLVFLFVVIFEAKRKQIKIFHLSDKQRKAAVCDILWYLLFLTAAYIPFLLIYLPVFQSSSGYSYGGVSVYLPEIIDLVNVTESNFMLGKWMGLLRLGDRGYSGEVEEGFSCVLLMLFFILFYILKRKNKQNRKIQLQMFLAENICTAVLLCMLLVIRLGSNGISLWALVYTLIPAARSVKAVARFWLWLSFPMAAVTAYCADQIMGGRSGRQGRKCKAVPAVCLILLFVSNINRNGAAAGWSAEAELAFISNVTAPPKEAECFYIIDSAETGEADYIYQLDAFEIGTYFSLQTINGYSGQVPAGWDGMWDVCSQEYENRVGQWIGRHGLTNVYAYDRAENVWIPYEERSGSDL